MLDGGGGLDTAEYCRQDMTEQPTLCPPLRSTPLTGIEQDRRPCDCLHLFTSTFVTLSMMYSVLTGNSTYIVVQKASEPPTSSPNHSTTYSYTLKQKWHHLDKSQPLPPTTLPPKMASEVCRRSLLLPKSQSPSSLDTGS